MHKEICPICHIELRKPYHHYMKHVERGEMVRDEVYKIVVNYVFRPPTELKKEIKMKTFVDGNSVFVAADNFANLQESPAVFGSCHDFCVAAAVAMVRGMEATRHESFVDVEDTDAIAFKSGGKILKVTIEWVEESEASPEKFQYIVKKGFAKYFSLTYWRFQIAFIFGLGRPLNILEIGEVELPEDNENKET